VSSLGGQLLRRLRVRFGQPAHPSAQDRLPPVPTVTGLTDAVAVAAHGRADATATQAGLLLAAARSEDPVLIGAAERLLAEADPRLWSALDISTRRSWWHAPLWTFVAVRRLMSGEPQPLELVLAACHPDGHVREAAMARISEVPPAVFGPILALRAADWVPQVRDRARLACHRWLNDAPSSALLALGPVALAVEQRHVGGWLADTMRTLLRQGPREVLAAGLAARDWRTRRTAYRSGLAVGRIDLDQMLRGALTDPDLPIRIACADAAIRHGRAAGGRDVVLRLLASRTAAIRADAVHTLGLAGELEVARAALLDRNPLVRATAQAITRRAGIDPAAHYRALVTSQHPPDPAAIAGVGETGVATDQDLLHPWLAHPRSRGRAETVRALRRLGAEPVTPLITMLVDPAPAVVRQVTLSLRPRAAALDEHLLRGFLAPTHARHVRVAAYRLLRGHDTWTRLAVDLQLANDGDIRLRGQARADLATWLDTEAATTYSPPTATRRAHLLDLLADSESVLGRDRARRLRFHVDSV
jgi:hypothetical protein